MKLAEEIRASEDKIPTLVKNEWFYLLARVCMVTATTVGLPIAAFALNRVVVKADEITAAQLQQNIELKLISAEIKMRFDNDGKFITDHELRLRSLERK